MKILKTAQEVVDFARGNGIRLNNFGIKFPNLCARSTIVFAANGFIKDEDGHTYIPMYQEKYENNTAFTQSELCSIEAGFEGGYCDEYMDVNLYKMGQNIYDLSR